MAISQQLMTAPPTAAPDLAWVEDVLDVDGMARHLTDQMLAQVYAEVVDPDVLRDLLEAATREKLRGFGDVLAGRTRLDELTPRLSLAFAAEVGRLGIAEQTFERSYRVGQELLWDWWMTVVERRAAQTGASIPDLLRAGMPVLFGFVDRMLFVSLSAFHDAASQRHRSHEQRRMRLIEQIVDGSIGGVRRDAERLLRYRVDQRHLAAVVTGGGRIDERRVGELAQRRLHGPELLVLDRGGQPMVLWIGGRTPDVVEQVRRLALDLEAVGCRVAVGRPRDGLEGFRETYRDAITAARVQRALADRAPSVVSVEDVAIEAMALASPGAASALVEGTLGPLLEDGRVPDVIDATLEAWLRSGSNVGAALALGVHEQTVRNRVRRIEEQLGACILQRRTELHAALRIARLDLADDPD